jgi:hypothetical protein
VTYPPFEVLTGPHVLVRAPAVGDEPALVEMATDPHVRRYLGGPQPPATAEANAAAKINDPRWGQFVIVEHATAVVAGSGSLARKRGPRGLAGMAQRSSTRRSTSRSPS